MFDFNYIQAQEFLLLFFRVAAIVISSPVLGHENTPGQVKIGLIFFLSVVSYSTVEINLPEGDHNTIFELVPLIASEMLVGITIGFAGRLIFAAVQFAGQMLGMQMGFAMVNVLDPVSNTQVSITSQALNMFAILTFLAVDGHYWFIRGIVYSFEIVDPGGFTLSGGLMETMVTLTSALFVTAIQLVAPVSAILLFQNVGLGVLARTVPQMNVFIVGLPLQILLGLLMLSMTLPIIYGILAEQFNGFGFQMIELLRLM